MADEKDKPKAVVKGNVSKSKRSLFGKIADTFTLGNIKDARNYIITDVVVPGFLDILYDGITRGASKLIYGDKGSPKERKKGRGIDYSGITRLSDGEAYRALSRKRERESSVSGIYDYNEIELTSRADAEVLLDSMYEYLEGHDIVTVADMYSMADYDGGDYTDNYWGWDDLRGSTIIRSSDGWMLKLPRVKNIKDLK